MTTKTALFALLAIWGVGGCIGAPALANAAESATEALEASPARRALTDRVWVKTGEDELPGVIRIFLSDGTLVQDSCWETHRLSPWQMTSETSLSWNEDGTDISADIVSISDRELVLRLALRGGDEVEHYTTADVPYVCPDIPT